MGVFRGDRWAGDADILLDALVKACERRSISLGGLTERELVPWVADGVQSQRLEPLEPKRIQRSQNISITHKHPRSKPQMPGSPEGKKVQKRTKAHSASSPALGVPISQSPVPSSVPMPTSLLKARARSASPPKDAFMVSALKHVHPVAV